MGGLSGGNHALVSASLDLASMVEGTKKLMNDTTGNLGGIIEGHNST